MGNNDEVTRNEFDKFQSHQADLELKQWELRDKSRDHDEAINLGKRERAILFNEQKQTKNLFNWTLKILFGSILGAMVTFVVKGGLVL